MPDLSIALQNYAVLTYGKRLHYVLWCQQAGQLNLPSGRLAVCDPHLTPEEAEPLEVAIAPGQYPVIVTHTCFDIGCEIAFASVILADGEVVRWEPGLGMREDEPLGYAVDSATGSYMSAETAALFADADWTAYPDIPWQSQRIYDALTASAGGWAELVYNEKQGLNLFAFTLGSDGGYVPWVGYDRAGKPVCVVTDFFGLHQEEIREWPEDYPPIPPGPFDAAFMEWMQDIQPFMRFPGLWITPEPMPAKARRLMVDPAVPLPTNLACFYDHCTPWEPGNTPSAEEWWETVANFREITGIEGAVVPILPGALAVLDEDGSYLIYEENTDGSRFLPHSGDIKVFLMTKIMLDLGEIR